MIEKTDESDQNDYSCEILSFVVLVILSALSHFWFILIGTGIAVLFWAAIALLGRLLRSAASALPSRSGAKQTNY